MPDGRDAATLVAGILTARRIDVTAADVDVVKVVQRTVESLSIWAPPAQLGEPQLVAYRERLERPIPRWSTPDEATVTAVLDWADDAVAALVAQFRDSWHLPVVRLRAAGTEAREVLRLTDLYGVSLAVHDDWPPCTGRWRWRWPLRIGVLEGPDAAERLAALAAGRWRAQLYQADVIGHDTPPGEFGHLDVLIVDDRSPGQLAGAVRGMVVALGGGLELAFRFGGVRRAGVTGATGAVAVTGRTDAAWIDRLVVELAHDAPLDVALAAAEPGAALRSTQRFLDITGVRSAVVAAAPDARRRGTSRIEEALELAALARQRTFDHESEGAADVVAVARRLPGGAMVVEPRTGFQSILLADSDALEDADPQRAAEAATVRRAEARWRAEQEAARQHAEAQRSAAEEASPRQQVAAAQEAALRRALEEEAVRQRAAEEEARRHIEEQSSQVPPVSAQQTDGGGQGGSFQSILLSDSDDQRTPLPIAGAPAADEPAPAVRPAGAGASPARPAPPPKPSTTASMPTSTIRVPMPLPSQAPPVPTPAPQSSGRSVRRRRRGATSAREPVALNVALARELQADVFVAGRAVRRAFVRGLAHEVEISVGHQGAIRTGTPFAEPVVPVGVDRVPLQVHCWYEDGSGPRRFLSTTELLLDRDRRRDARPGRVTVTPSSDVFTLTIAVCDGADFLQGAKLWGDVVASADDEVRHDRTLELRVDAWVKTLAPKGSPVGAHVVVDDDLRARGVGPHGAFSADLSALHDDLQALTARIETAAQELLDGDAAAFERVLRDLARHGRRLYDIVRPQLGAVCDAEHLQIVSAGAATVLPLELVYDGPPVGDRAHLCPTWREALVAGVCPTCRSGPDAGGTVDPHAAVCPMRFWAISKVIERHRVDSSGDGRYRIMSVREHAGDRLGALDRAIVGASSRVDKAGRSVVVRAARDRCGSASQVATWAAWRRALRGRRPPNVLVAMPHRDDVPDVDPPLEALEIGRSLLALDHVTADVVSAADRAPGPLVILLGCSTANDQTPIDSFASRFLHGGAAVVVSTLGVVFVEHAVPAARTLLAALAPVTPDDTIGTVLRATRRSLLAERNLVGLLLVALGDAGWLLPAA